MKKRIARPREATGGMVPVYDTRSHMNAIAVYRSVISVIFLCMLLFTSIPKTRDTRNNLAAMEENPNIYYEYSIKLIVVYISSRSKNTKCK